MPKYNPVATGTYTLGASIGSTDNSILLSSFADPTTGVPITMVTLNTDIAYGTIGPRTSSFELISFTGITQNLNGTATLTGVTRGLSRQFPFTADTNYRLPHSGQSLFILSDAPQVFIKYASLENDNTFTGDNTFDGDDEFTNHSPTIPTELSSEIHRAASIEFVNDIAIAGSPKATNTVYGISKLSVAASAADPIVVGTNDNRVSPVSLATLTSGMVDALQGTSGVPSSSNDYVTNDDTATAATANKLARRLASGDVTVPSTPTNGTDAASKTYVDAGVASALSKIVIVPADVTITNTTTETAFFTQSITGGTLGTSNGIRVKMYITDWQNDNGTSHTFVFRFKYGATTLITTASYTPSSSASGNRNVGDIEFLLMANASTSAQTATARIITLTQNSSAQGQAFGVATSGVQKGTSSIDSTSAQNLVITGQWSGVNGSNTITVSGITVEKIR